MTRKELQEILAEVKGGDAEKYTWAFNLIWNELEKINEARKYCQLVVKMDGIVFGQGTAENILGILK